MKKWNIKMKVFKKKNIMTKIININKIIMINKIYKLNKILKINKIIKIKSFKRTTIKIKIICIKLRKF